MSNTGTTLPIALATVLIIAATPALGDLIWFDETNGGTPYGDFLQLHDVYRDFMGPAPTLVSFADSGLREGTLLGDQYADSLGVRFSNTGSGRYQQYSGLRAEGGSIAEHITGYDDSYMPHGSPVYTKFDNDNPNAPFTIDFAEPVSRVGAFVGMGVQGPTHSLTISIYDQADLLLGRRQVESWLWERNPSKQNYESFFAVASDAALIGRVEILNDARQDFANALLIDNIAFDTQRVPEPSTGLFMLGIGGVIFWQWTRQRRT